MSRERLAFAILIAVLIFLFAFTFAVLGKGEYEPGGASFNRNEAQTLWPITPSVMNTIAVITVQSISRRLLPWV